ncbi:hypothetical protein NQZ68_019749 [Dissostichus eleginoides]|nr:hypothetical protein NQZ68_019749 [Dissostichus eleginoides]
MYCMRRFIVSFEPCRFQFLLTSRELNLPQPACLIALIVSFSGYSEAMVPPNPPRLSDYPMGRCRPQTEGQLKVRQQRHPVPPGPAAHRKRGYIGSLCLAPETPLGQQRRR